MSNDTLHPLNQSKIAGIVLLILKQHSGSTKRSTAAVFAHSEMVRTRMSHINITQKCNMDWGSGAGCY